MLVAGLYLDSCQAMLIVANAYFYRQTRLQLAVGRKLNAHGHCRIIIVADRHLFACFAGNFDLLGQVAKAFFKKEMVGGRVEMKRGAGPAGPRVAVRIREAVLPSLNLIQFRRPSFPFSHFNYFITAVVPVAPAVPEPGAPSCWSRR